jgi:hypothetical protein
VVVMGWLAESRELFDAESAEHLVLLRTVRHFGEGRGCVGVEGG